MQIRRATAILALAGLAWACGADLAELDLSQAVAPGLDCYDVSVDGATVDLVFAAPAKSGREEDGREIFHTRSVDGGVRWTQAVRIDAGCEPVSSVHQWVGPQLAGRGDDLVAVWTTSGSGFMGRGPMATALSSDGGASWRPGPEPAALPERGGQAFVDLVVDEAGSYHLIWLGKRGDREAQKGLYYTHSEDAGGHWSEPAAVDSETCECCWNRLSVSEGGDLYALYRDLGPRDMAVARKRSGESSWDWLGHSGPFDWQFDGCPHVGGDILPLDTSSGRALHSVVWTGKESDAGVYYVGSVDDGANWRAPVRMGDRTAKHAHLAAVDATALQLAWDQAGPHGSSVHAVHSTDGGQTWSEPELLSSGGASGEYPGLFAVDGAVRAFWFEWHDDQRVLKTAVLEAPRSPGPRGS